MARIFVVPVIVASGDSAKEVGQRLSIEERMPPDKENLARSGANFHGVFPPVPQMRQFPTGTMPTSKLKAIMGHAVKNARVLTQRREGAGRLAATKEDRRLRIEDA
jgi:hypothetical protein